MIDKVLSGFSILSSKAKAWNETHGDSSSDVNYVTHSRALKIC